MEEGGCQEGVAGEKYGQTMGPPAMEPYWMELVWVGCAAIMHVSH